MGDYNTCERCGSENSGEPLNWTPKPHPVQYEYLYFCDVCFVELWPANIHVVVHYGCPEFAAKALRNKWFLEQVRRHFPKLYGTIHLFNRREAETLTWLHAWDGERLNNLPTEPYSYRGWCKYWSGEIVILCDETETERSIQWIALHELGHLQCGKAPFFDYAMEQENKNNNRTTYDWKDDWGHEVDAEEKLVNRIATAYMGGYEYARPWWRPRVQAKLAGLPLEQFPDNPTVTLQDLSRKPDADTCP